MVSWTTILIILILCFVLFTLIGIWVVMKIIFKHRVRIIDLGKQSIELDYKARDKIKEGVRYWELDKERNKELKYMPVPPADAINIAKKGKKSVECIRTETGEYIFLNRNINLPLSTELKRKLVEIEQEAVTIQDKKEREKFISDYRRNLLGKWGKENEGMVIEAYQPFTSKQRMILMNNFIKSQSRKQFSIREHIPTMVSIGALVLLVVMLMIFWGDIAKPALEARSIGLTEQENAKEILLILQDIKTGQQRIESEQKGDK